MTIEDKLVTRAEWDRLPAIAQGFVCYMQAKRPGSELSEVCKTCPYPEGSEERKQFQRGEFEGIDLCQDLDS